MKCRSKLIVTCFASPTFRMLVLAFVAASNTALAQVQAQPGIDCQEN